MPPPTTPPNDFLGIIFFIYSAFGLIGGGGLRPTPPDPPNQNHKILCLCNWGHPTPNFSGQPPHTPWFLRLGGPPTPGVEVPGDRLNFLPKKWRKMLNITLFKKYSAPLALKSIPHPGTPPRGSSAGPIHPTPLPPGSRKTTGSH